MPAGRDARRLPAAMTSIASRTHKSVNALGGTLEAGSYFTDGVGLFRVVSVTSGSGGPRAVELEDCRTLEVALHAGDALTTLGFTAVRPEHAGKASS